MNTQTRDYDLMRSDQVRQVAPVVAALLVGSLVGAGAMMLLAPQSGRETRSRIQDKSRELRERAVGGARGAVKQVSSRTHDLKDSFKGKADELEEHGRQAVAQQLDKIAAAAEAGKKAVRK